MNPAETYARLKLLELALRRVLPAAAEAAEAYRESVRAKTLETDHGTVTGVRPQPAISLDPEAFLAWVVEHRPDEIRPTVNPAFRAAYLAELRVVGDCVIDRNGEVIEFASVRRGRPYLTTRFTEDAKRAAEAVVVEQVEAWSLPEVES